VNSKLQIAQDMSTNPTTGSFGTLSITGATNPNYSLSLGYNTSGNYGVIQAMLSGTAYETLTLNPNGGNVGIGSTVPSQGLDVTADGGTIRGTGRFYSGADSPGGIWVDGGSTQFVGSYDSTHVGIYSGAWTLYVGNNYVGIGTASPNAALQVRGNTNANLQITSPSYVTGAVALFVRNAFQAIIDAAKTKGCDFIVMASHGRSGISAIVLGSVAVKVLLTHSTIPVLVYRESPPKLL
jgi:Universal stress protein family